MDNINYFSAIREQWIRNKYVDRLFVKPLPNNELTLKEFDTRKWSVRKVRRRGNQHQSTQKNDVMIFESNVNNMSVYTLSSDDDSTISDCETEKDSKYVIYKLFIGK